MSFGQTDIGKGEPYPMKKIVALGMARSEARPDDDIQNLERLGGCAAGG